MDKLELQYTILYQEAYEAFYVLASRRTIRTRNITAALLTVITVVMLVLYAKDGIGIHYLFLAICSVALLFYILYQPVISAKRGASKVEKTAGEYKISFYSDGTIQFPNGESLIINEDKYSRVVETEKVYALRINANYTVCIPKRILKKEDEEFIRVMFLRQLSKAG